MRIKQLAIIAALTLMLGLAACAEPQKTPEPEISIASPEEAEETLLHTEGNSPGFPPLSGDDELTKLWYRGLDSLLSELHSSPPQESADTQLINTVWELIKPEVWGEYVAGYSPAWEICLQINFAGYSGYEQGYFIISPDDMVTFFSYPEAEVEKYSQNLSPETMARYPFLFDMFSTSITHPYDSQQENGTYLAYYYRLSEGTYEETAQLMRDKEAAMIPFGE